MLDARKPVRVSGSFRFTMRGDPKQVARMYLFIRRAELAAMWASVLDVKAGAMRKYNNNVLRRRSSPGLYGSVNADVIERGLQLIGVIGTHLIYGKTHEFGAVIRPKNGPWLVFKVDGRWVRAKKVTIPKRPVFAPALREAEPRILRYFDRAIGQALKAAGA